MLYIGNHLIKVANSTKDSCEIKDDILTIADCAFYDCDRIKNITIPSSVKTIGIAAFENCSFENVYYKGNISDWCSIYFDEYRSNPMKDADNLFINGNLVSGEIIIPGDVDSVGDFAFFNCTSIKKLILSHGILSVGNRAFEKCTSLEEITISNTINNIGYRSFYKCTSLLSIIMPNSITNVGNDAFAMCSALNSVILSNGITNISSSMFSYCQSLTNITIPNTITSISNNAFENCYSLSSIDIPNSVTEIDDCAFQDCLSLASIMIPDSVKSIGEYAFVNTAYYNDSSNWEENVLYINKHLIKAETDITDSYSIKSGTIEIADYAFSGCNKLTSISIPSSVKYFGIDVFIDNTSLADVYYLGDLAGWSIIDFPLYHSNPMCYAKNLYINGNLVAGVLIIPDGVTSIGGYTFVNCTALSQVTIPKTVKTIDYCAFLNCSSLDDVVIENGVVSIGHSAFNGCISLDRIALPSSVTSIGEDAFEDCYYIASVSLSENITNIHDSAFEGCYRIKDVYFVGSKEEWSQINIGKNNDYLKNAIIYYNHIHQFVETVVTPVDCLNDGEGYGICVCGLKTDMYTIPTTGHNIIIDKGVVATCTETGLTEGQHCSRCNDVTVEQDFVPALNHKDTLVQVDAKAPTCTEIGWDAYEYCTACTYTTYEEKSALDHDIIIDEAIAATCTETGLTKGQHCSRCDGATISQEVISVKSHEYTVKYDSSKHWEECVCGAKINTHNHTFGSNSLCDCGYKRVVNATIAIKNNNGSKTINYGETLKLTAVTNNKPYDAKIYWYVDGVLMGEGEVFNVNFESGAKVITVKLVDSNGYALQNTDGDEIFDLETVNVKSGFFQKLISFFKNLFGIGRVVVQSIRF